MSVSEGLSPCMQWYPTKRLVSYRIYQHLSGWNLPPLVIRGFRAHCHNRTLAKIGAKVVSHGRYVTFQFAEVAVPRELFRKILSLIDDLRPRPAPA